MAANDYQSLSEQLDDIVERLQQPNIPIDEAVKLYEQGLKIVKQCEQRLKAAENKISKLKLQSSGEEPQDQKG